MFSCLRGRGKNNLILYFYYALSFTMCVCLWFRSNYLQTWSMSQRLCMNIMISLGNWHQQRFVVKKMGKDERGNGHRATRDLCVKSLVFTMEFPTKERVKENLQLFRCSFALFSPPQSCCCTNCDIVCEITKENLFISVGSRYKIQSQVIVCH